MLHLDVDQNTAVSLVGSYIDLIHNRFAYCKRCNFALHYDIGDNLFFQYEHYQYQAVIKRIIDNHLMEITIIQNKDYDKIKDHISIVITNYYLI